MSGIGISGRRSEGIAVSFDAYNKILTVILYIKPSGNCAYLQNAWRRSGGDRFDGDAISVYNNGPLARTSAAADRFYEIATYSPALELAAGKSQFHLQRTFHFGGSEYDLGLISYKLTASPSGSCAAKNSNPNRIYFDNTDMNNHFEMDEFLLELAPVRALLRASNARRRT